MKLYEPLERLLTADVVVDPRAQVPLPVVPAMVPTALVHVHTRSEAERIVRLLSLSRVALLSLDLEWRYRAHLAALATRGAFKGQPLGDIRAIDPLAAALAAVIELPNGTLEILPAVFEIQNGELVDSLRAILDLNVVVTMHWSRQDQHALRSLGLEPPARLFDTGLAVSLLNQGLFSRRTYEKPTDADPELAGAARAREAKEIAADLVTVCRRYQVAYPYTKAQKKAYQRSFLDHPPGKPLAPGQVRYAAADAIAEAQIYLPVVQDLAIRGQLDRFLSIEMPYLKAVARVEWTGLKQDRDRSAQEREQAKARLRELDQELAAAGITNARSSKQIIAFARKSGFLDELRASRNAATPKYSTSKKVLSRAASGRPVIKAVMRVRHVRQLLDSRLLDGEYISSVTGRVHPYWDAAGAESGRTSTREPNVMGLPGALRPIFVAEPGYGYVELDVVAEEPYVAAFLAGDQQLREDYERGDVYVPVGRSVVGVDTGDLALEDAALCEKYPELRKVSKRLFLAVLYGFAPETLAQELGISVAAANTFMDSFYKRYPAVKALIDQLIDQIEQVGYVSTKTGLRRNRRLDRAATTADHRWARNHPIQGTSADLLKLAVGRLDAALPALGGEIHVLLHDAALLYGPLGSLAAIAAEGKAAFEHAFAVVLPGSKPRIKLRGPAGFWLPKD